jgi:hypothetical protein
MAQKTLSLALAGLMMVAPCGQAEEPGWPDPRLQRRADERGPIRTQIEAALAVPAKAITAQAVEAARREARGQSSSSKGSSIPGWAWALIVPASLFALWHEWAKGWSKI